MPNWTDAQIKYYEIPAGWNWNWNIPGWGATKLILDKYNQRVHNIPDIWEFDLDNEPYYHTLYYTNATGGEAHKLATAWDDVTDALFYWSSLPNNRGTFFRPGDSYRAAFCFQNKAARERFILWLHKRNSGD